MQFECLNEAEFLDLIIVPFWEGNKKAEIAFIKKAELAFLDSSAFSDFLGKKGETLFVYEKDKKFLLLGLGKEAEATLEIIRFSYGEAMQQVLKKKILEISVVLPDGQHFLREMLIFAVSEGLALANYSFDKFKKEKQPLVKKIVFPFSMPSEKISFEKLLRLREAVFLARDLINDNADNVTPAKLAEVAKKLAKEHHNLKVKVFDKKEIKEMKMGLLLAVNQGSTLDPAFIEISYQNNPKSKEHVVLVGKGLTFDSGGLCLKPSTSMDTMRCDMSGAAAVLAILKVLAQLGTKINVTGLIAATENAISSTSYKPGDTFVGMSGKSVEIVNTDAEGRLILADALSYANEKIKPTRIIDIATLTGAISIALGEEIIGLFSNDDSFTEELQKSSVKTGEDVWRLPLPPSYLSLLKSDIADIKNCGERIAGSITAALFLKEFVDPKTPWIHLDIAGTAWSKKNRGYITQFGTGASIRLIFEYLEELSKKG